MKQLRKEVKITKLALLITTVSAVMLMVDTLGIFATRLHGKMAGGVVEQATFLVIAYFLIYGNIVYQLARLGHLRRQIAHVTAMRDELESVYGGAKVPSLAVLIPSYKEERAVVMQTLLSAGLMEYPCRDIVLLIDDPPKPADTAAQQQLESMRTLPNEIAGLFAPVRKRFANELKRFEHARSSGRLNVQQERCRLARLYKEAAGFLEKLAGRLEIRDHTDQLFVERILRTPARVHREHSEGLIPERSHGWRGPYAAEKLAREYRRLAGLFEARFISFERKQYVNLSHAPNKAMNLNAYIGLMGGYFRVETESSGAHLVPCEPAVAELAVPDADYLITLDADSLLLNEYAITLIHFMEQPENTRVAVAQTPYSAIPGTRNLLERMAGATTDIQHIIHQGFTKFGATFWVGANALLRHTALCEIAHTTIERGFVVTKYIEDRTVIEDTESSVDLVMRGWQLYNYPERLAYSATPPDFGSLVIQRRRWANGGLIILPKLLSYLSGGAKWLREFPGAMMRVHYLTSLAGVSLATVILLVHSFESSMRNWWLPLTAMPYYLLYGRDLVAIGYRWSDLPRVYALNLLLIPVNLGGVCQSLYQACTGRPTPFGRTPKVTGRTAAPPLYVIGAMAIFVWCIGFTVADVFHARWVHALFGLVNAAFMGYAIVHLIGIRAAWEDVRVLWTRSEVQTFDALNVPDPERIAAWSVPFTDASDANSANSEDVSVLAPE